MYQTSGGRKLKKEMIFMPRHAIRDYDTSFFHVMVQGINKTHIFKDNSEKDNYLNIMYKYIS